VKERYRSLTAMRWAAMQRTGSGTANHLLMAMAALVSDKPMTMTGSGREWPALHCWAEPEKLASITEQNRKTIDVNLRKLIAAGLILDAGRCGANGRTRAFKLLVDPTEIGRIDARLIRPLLPSDPTDNGILHIEAKEGKRKEGSAPPIVLADRGKANGRAIKAMTLAAWRAEIKAAGEKALPEHDPIFDYADEIGLTVDMIHAQWHAFVQAFTEDRPTKLYADWRATFRASVRGNWFRLWFIDGANGPKWTTVGQQALMSLNSRQVDPAPADASTNAGAGAGTQPGGAHACAV
jgi:hypothetical protein